MEPKFRVVTHTELSHCRQFAAAVLDTKKQMVTFLVLILSSAVLFFCSLVFWIPALLGASLALYLYALLYRIFTPIWSGNATYRNLPEHEKLGESTYDFDDEFFYCRNEMRSSTIRYQSIEDVKETEDLFLLYVSPVQAHMLRKDGFALGTVGEFRGFIEEKAEVDIERVWPKKTAPRLVGGLLALVAIFVVGIVLLAVRWSTPVAYYDSYGCYVEVPATFQYGYDSTLNLYNAEVGIYSYYADMGGSSLSDFAAYYFDSYEDVDFIEYQKTDSGILCGRYLFHEDDGSYYYTTAFVRAPDNSCCVVTFWCDASLRDLYEMDFLTWADSIGFVE